MNEEERLKRLKEVEQEIQIVRGLKEKRKRLKELSMSKDVLEYLKLQDEVAKVDIKTISSIKRYVFSKNDYDIDCPHDILFFMGSYRVEYDQGYGQDRYYREQDKNKIEFYEFRCLECFKIIGVSLMI